jgi:LuxR family maltose regulon positive regulatory protein
LVEILERSGDMPLILVSAPAGYGKSTLVSEWISASDSSFAWLSLDEDDNDLYTLAGYMACAVRKTVPEFGSELLELLEGPERPPENIIQCTLINALAQLQSHIVIVFDDFHMIHSGAIMKMLVELLEHPSRYIQIALITRRDPEISLERMRMKNRVCEIRAADLLFDLSEIGQFIKNSSGRLSTEAVEHAKAATEGWAAGLRMFLLNLDSDAADWKSRAGYISTAVEHLVEGVLHRFDETMLDFIHAACHLDRFSAEMLGFVTSREEKAARTFIEKMEVANLFIIPLDDAKGWYRFHHLFSDLIREKSSKDHWPGSREQILGAAARWYGINNDRGQQIRLLTRSGDFELAEEVFATYRLELMNRCDWLVLSSLFHMFPPEYVVQSRLLSLTECWLEVYNGRIYPMFDRLEDISRRLDIPGGASCTAEIAGEFHALHVYDLYHRKQQFEQCLEEATAALEYLPPDHSMPRGYAQIFRLAAMQILGHGQQALDELSGLLDPSKNSMEQSFLRLTNCYLYYLEGDQQSLKRSADDLISYGQRIGNNEALANGYHFAAIASYFSGHMETARDLSSAAHKLRLHTIGVIQIMNAICLAYSHYFMGDSTKAFSLLDQVIDEAQSAGNALYVLIGNGALSFLKVLEGNGRDAAGWVRYVESVPLSAMSNFFNLHFVRLQLPLLTGTGRNVQHTARLCRATMAYAERTGNVRIQHDLVLLEAILAFRGKAPEMSEELFRKAFSMFRSSGIISPVIEMAPVLAEVLQAEFLDPADTYFLEQILKPYDFILDDAIVDLTRREQQILDGIVQGLTNKEIAAELFISDKTVKRHANGLYKKLGVNGRRQAARWAKEYAG